MAHEPIVFTDLATADAQHLSGQVRKILASLWAPSSSEFQLDPKAGRFPSQQGSEPHHDLTTPEKTMAAVIGILMANGVTHAQEAQIHRQVIEALGEYSDRKELFDNVLTFLLDEGRTGGSETPEREVEAQTWAVVTRALDDQGIRKADPHARLRVRNALAAHIAGGDQDSPSRTEIRLPNLETHVDHEILKNNIIALQVVYFAYQLEELKFFQVADRLLDLFNQNQLPVGRGRATDLLSGYWKDRLTPSITEAERHNLFVRCLGAPGGEGTVATRNTEFNDLLQRFVAAVAAYSKQFTFAMLLPSNNLAAISQERVRKAGRDLAANLSLRGYGIGWFAATELQKQIERITAVLGDAEIRGAFGARDLFQVIEQVSAQYLGGPVNSVRYRTLANSGAVIIRWLANHSDKLSGVNGNVLDTDQLRHPAKHRGPAPLVSPSDADLLDACEQWLAVTGITDQRVAELSQPFAGPDDLRLSPIRAWGTPLAAPTPPAVLSTPNARIPSPAPISPAPAPAPAPTPVAPTPTPAPE